VAQIARTTAFAQTLRLSFGQRRRRRVNQNATDFT
jgi:hypothetical protein